MADDGDSSSGPVDTSGGQGGSGGVGRAWPRRDVAEYQYFSSSSGGLSGGLPTVGQTAILIRGPGRRGLGASQDEETGLHSGAAAGVRRYPEPPHPDGRQHESFRRDQREKVLR